MSRVLCNLFSQWNNWYRLNSLVAGAKWQQDEPAAAGASLAVYSSPDREDITEVGETLQQRITSAVLGGRRKERKRIDGDSGIFSSGSEKNHKTEKVFSQASQIHANSMADLNTIRSIRGHYTSVNDNTIEGPESRNVFSRNVSNINEDEEGQKESFAYRIEKNINNIFQADEKDTSNESTGAFQPALRKISRQRRLAGWSLDRAAVRLVVSSATRPAPPLTLQPGHSMGYIRSSRLDRQAQPRFS